MQWRYMIKKKHSLSSFRNSLVSAATFRSVIILFNLRTLPNFKTPKRAKYLFSIPVIQKISWSKGIVAERSTQSLL
jgi:hypothetical protein